MRPDRTELPLDGSPPGNSEYVWPQIGGPANAARRLAQAEKRSASGYLGNRQRRNRTAACSAPAVVAVATRVDQWAAREVDFRGTPNEEAGGNWTQHAGSATRNAMAAANRMHRQQGEWLRGPCWRCSRIRAAARQSGRKTCWRDGDLQGPDRGGVQASRNNPDTACVLPLSSPAHPNSLRMWLRRAHECHESEMTPGTEPDHFVWPSPGHRVDPGAEELFVDVIPVRPHVCPQRMLQHVNLGTRDRPLSGRSPDAAGMRGLVEQHRLKGHARWGQDPIGPCSSRCLNAPRPR